MAADGLIVLGLDVSATQANIQSELDGILNNAKTRKIILKTAIEKAETEKQIDATVSKLSKKTVKMGIQIDAKDVNSILAAQQKIASTQAKLNSQMQEYRKTAKEIGITLNKDTWNAFRSAVSSGDFTKATEILRSAKKQIEEYHAAVKKMNADTSVTGSVSTLINQFSKLQNVSSATQSTINLLKANLSKFEKAKEPYEKLSAYQRLKSLIESLSAEYQNLKFAEQGAMSDAGITKQIKDAESYVKSLNTVYSKIGDSQGAQNLKQKIQELQSALDGMDRTATGGKLTAEWQKVAEKINEAKRAVSEYKAEQISISATEKSNSADLAIKKKIEDATSALTVFETKFKDIGNSDAAKKVTSSIDGLRTALNNVKNDATGNDLQNQWNAVEKAINEAKRAVSEYHAVQGTKQANINLLSGISSGASGLLDSVSASGMTGSGIDDLKVKLQNAKTEAEALKMQLIQTASTSPEYKQIVEQIEALNRAFKQTKQDAKVFEDVNSLEQFKTNIEKARQKVNEFDKTYSAVKGNPNLMAELTRLKSQLDEVSTPSQFKEWNTQFEQFNTKVKQAGLHTQSLSDKLKTAFKNFASFFSASRLIYEVFNKFGEMINYVKQIDAAMVNLRKVTDETSASYDRFLTNAKANAKELGTTVADLVTATANFSKLGFDMDEAEELGQLATIYANVGDLNSIDDATNSLISSMKGFGLETEDAASILDKFNEVGNNFAISSGDIGEALQRSASSMAAANNTIDETIALITAANTVVQDATSVGTAFKTKFLRLSLHTEMCA